MDLSDSSTDDASGCRNILVGGDSFDDLPPPTMREVVLKIMHAPKCALQTITCFTFNNFGSFSDDVPPPVEHF